MENGKYFYIKMDYHIYLKMTGNLKYTGSTGFDHFLKELFKQDYKEIIIDLSEAEYIDSTNLGLIGRIAENSFMNHNSKTTLISTNSEINYILSSVGFDEVFEITEKELNIYQWTEIPIEQADPHEIADIMLKAHKTLMDVDERNVHVFKDVVDIMEKEQKERHNP